MESTWTQYIGPDANRLVGNHYRIIQSLGRGTFGVVFQAEDIKFTPPRQVAIKLLSPHTLIDPQIREAIKYEANILARFNHPNILRIIDFDITEDFAYIVTDLAEKGSFSNILRPDISKPPMKLSLDVVDNYLKQITAGLDEAHNQGLVHRDIKPANILINKEGRLLLADFGLAEILSSSQSSVLQDTKPSGTPLYMAPEQWLGQTNKASDIYALGVLTYQMLTGQPPYQGNLSALENQHTKGQIPSLRDRAPDLVYPDALDQVIAHAMAKDYKQRPKPSSEYYRLFQNACTSPMISGKRAEPVNQTLPDNPRETSSPSLNAAPKNQTLSHIPLPQPLAPSGYPSNQASSPSFGQERASLYNSGIGNPLNTYSNPILLESRPPLNQTGSFSPPKRRRGSRFWFVGALVLLIAVLCIGMVLGRYFSGISIPGSGTSLPVVVVLSPTSTASVTSLVALPTKQLTALLPTSTATNTPSAILVPTVASSADAFADDFTPPLKSDWLIRTTGLAIVNNHLTGSGRLSYKTKANDYKIIVHIDHGGVSINFRENPEKINIFYVVSWDGKNCSMTQYGESLLGEGYPAYPIQQMGKVTPDIDNTKPFDMIVIAQGRNFSVYIGDPTKPVLYVADETYKTGIVGVSLDNGQIERFEVDPL